MSTRHANIRFYVPQDLMERQLDAEPYLRTVTTAANDLRIKSALAQGLRFWDVEIVMERDPLNPNVLQMRAVPRKAIP